ncbi:MAG TPA: hypothetical protein VF544_21900 [Pyrinomonadaceae bacterium]|jgi:hypothetical protein
MKTLYCALASLLLLSSLGPVRAQGQSVKSKREIVQEEQLSRLLSRVGVTVDTSKAASGEQSQAYREMKIRWTGQATAQADAAATASSAAGAKQEPALSSLVLDEKTLRGTLPRQRSLELSPTQVFVAAVDESSHLRWWATIPDPRIVRAETQTASGELRSQDYYLADLTLVLAFPADPSIASLRFYHPAWNGTAYDLQLLAQTPVK